MHKNNTAAQQTFVSKINPKPDPHDMTISTWEYESRAKAFEIIERIAAIDHDQWIYWSTNIMRDMDQMIQALNDVHNLMLESSTSYANSPAHHQVKKLIEKHNERDIRWQNLNCAYKHLPEEQKESNRIWAKKEYEATKT